MTGPPAPKCGAISKFGLTEDEKRRITDLHNKLRQFVASGNETRGIDGPQPPAKYGLPILEWDDEIAAIAQRWADQCNINRDGCRNTGKKVIYTILAKLFV